MVALLAPVLLSACEAREVARDGLEQVASAAVKHKNEQIAALGDKAGAYVDGELAGWLGKEGIEGKILAQSGSAAEVARIAVALGRAVDGETVILPVYRSVGDDRADVDRAIGDMPHTEVVDGVTVGFKQLKKTDTSEHVTEDAYLVLWRRDDKLLGFVYKKRSRIDIAVLTREVPALMKKVEGALQ
jgi:hypothetical protein